MRGSSRGVPLATDDGKWTPLTLYPVSRSLAGMAYDAQSDRAVVFGGSTVDGRSDETWSYNMDAGWWNRQHPLVHPQARWGPMSYDAESDLVVMFGGSTAEGASNETWVYDLDRDVWDLMPSTNGPSARFFHAMAYDSKSDRIVMFGGLLASGGRSQETWSYDHNTNTWKLMMEAPSPAARERHAMAYDVQSDRIILFGGSSAGGVTSNETWSYDVDSDIWGFVNPSKTPSPQRSHVMAYDSQSDRVILFGAETWAYDHEGNVWTQMSPATRPSAGDTMVYDSQSDRMVLFGGSRGLTWSYDFDDDTWSAMPGPTKPSTRSRHAMAYDSNRDRTVLFGGNAAGGPRNDTWSYDLNANAWTLMSPPTAPSAREGHAMVFDSESGEIVLFGGLTALGYDDETWSYDLAADAWTLRKPAVRPSARWGHAMAYDTHMDRIILFGGSYGTQISPQVSNETWSFDTNRDAWTLMSPDQAPPPSDNAALAYDVESREMVHLSGARVGRESETWSYNTTANAWSRVGTTGPSGTDGHVSAYDSESDRTVVFGGWRLYPSDATWAYDHNARAWGFRSVVERPPGRVLHAMAYDAESDRIVLFGGVSFGSGATDEVWSYEEPDASSPPVPPPPPPDDSCRPCAPGRIWVVRAVADRFRVTLEWDPVIFDGGSPVTHYKIYRGSLIALVGNVRTYTDTAVTRNSTYTYQVSALNDVGEGPRSMRVFVSLLPNVAPTATVFGLTENATVSGTVTLAGTVYDPDGDFAKAEVRVDDGMWKPVQGVLRSWSFELDTTTLRDGNHTIDVRAFDGFDYSPTVTLRVVVDNSAVRGGPSALVSAGLIVAAALVAVLVTRFVIGRFRRKS